MRSQLPWLPRRLLALLVTLTLLVPAIAGGTPYVWCVGLKRAQLTCCCHARHAAGADQGHEHAARRVDTIENECCVGQRVASVPTTDLPSHPVPALVPPTMVVTWLTIAALYPVVDEPDPATLRRYECDARAGPEPPLYAVDCAWLN